MTDELTPDEIRQALREVFADQGGLVEVRGARDGHDRQTPLAVAGFDPERWATLAEQVGLAALAAPEQWGGLGLGLAALTAAVEECGASLYPGPVSAALQVGLALRGADPASTDAEIVDAVEAMLAGRIAAGFGNGEGTLVDGRFDGTLHRVTHGAVAGLALAEVRLPQGTALVLAVVPEGSDRRRVEAIDLTTPRADLGLRNAPAVVLAMGSDKPARTSHVTAGRLLLAAEQVGGIEGCLAQMVDYAKVREQFGALIGSYQAIQHRCAETAIDAASSRALVAAGAEAFDRDEVAVAYRYTLLAQAEAASRFVAASDSLIQVCGGIGFTWEHDAHLFFRRARAIAPRGGAPEALRHRAVEAGCLDLLAPA
ncbi:acyl-CoA dehydrogenase family protein [Nocardioides dubius]|uniref:Acyl-CoA dehydrogenase family protein n=1 Tax=Nocardioides dubius TaxID=317019 RepID=A0ABN1TQZ0_9ACTN